MPDMPMQPPQGQDQQQPQATPQSVQNLVTGIHTDLLKFKELLGAAPQVPDQVKQGLDQVISDYQGFVGGLASAMKGGGQPEEEQSEGEAPPAPQGGPVPVKKGPMPMSGGPGAKPAL